MYPTLGSVNDFSLGVPCQERLGNSPPEIPLGLTQCDIFCHSIQMYLVGKQAELIWVLIDGKTLRNLWRRYEEADANLTERYLLMYDNW